MEIKIKKNSMTTKAFNAFADNGIPEDAVIKAVKVGGMASVTVNGNRIGNIVGMKYADLPNSYSISLLQFSKETGICSAELKEDTLFDDVLQSEPVQEAATEKAEAVADWKKQRIESMRCNGVHESVIAACAKRWGDKEMISKPSVEYKDTNGETVRALISALTGSGTLLMGPKSTGKNVLMRTLAYYLNVPYWRMNLDQKSMPEDLYGSKTTDNSAADRLRARRDLAESYLRFKNGDESELSKAAEFEILKAEANSIHIVQQDSSFIRWARSGGVFNADEINLWPTDIVVSGLNSLLDGEKTVSVESTGETINVPENSYFFGGMNPGYEGTVELNEAFKSRLNILILDYPDSVEKQIRANFGASASSEARTAENINAGFKPGHLPKSYIKACDDLFSDLRKMVGSGRVTDTVMNIRGLVRALRMVDAFPDAITLSDALQMSIVNGCEDDEKTIIRQCIADRIDF